MKDFFQKALTFFIPHRCLLCREEVLSAESLCGACWPKLSYISSPQCDCCGFPFDFEVEQGSLCAACIQKKPPFTKARSALFYSEASKTLILRFKHGDGTELAPVFAKWLVRAGRDLISESDFIVPVPLHWSRLLKRRYNQAALLGKALSHLSGIPFLPLGLKRYEKTPSQGVLSARQRFKNVKNVFRVSKSYQKKLIGKRVLLVDDVYTSGATVYHASKVLIKAGADAVYVLTVARVQGPSRL
tara:strand:- start:403 stop:1134 length:732 start_codon:yes stop_codon:yes gene_type:complete